MAEPNTEKSSFPIVAQMHGTMFLRAQAAALRPRPLRLHQDLGGGHCVAHDHEGTPVDQSGGKFLGDVWGHVVAPRAWTLGEAANRGGLTGCVVLRPPEPKAAPRHGHQLARS